MFNNFLKIGCTSKNIKKFEILPTGKHQKNFKFSFHENSIFQYLENITKKLMLHHGNNFPKKIFIIFFMATFWQCVEHMKKIFFLSDPLPEHNPQILFLSCRLYVGNINTHEKPTQIIYFNGLIMPKQIKKDNENTCIK